MNWKNLAKTIVAVFVFIWLSDWLIHGNLLKNAYQETASMWRTPEEMQSHMLWMFLGQMLLSIFFCVIFVKGYEGRGWMEGVRYGVLIGLFGAAPMFIQYAVSPLPAMLLWAWVAACIIQSIGGGVVAAWAYKK